MEQFILERHGPASPIVIGRVFTTANNGKAEIPENKLITLGQENKLVRDELVKAVEKFDRTMTDLRKQISGFGDRVEDFYKQLAILRRDVDDLTKTYYTEDDQ